MWIDCGETKYIQTKRDKQKNGETELKSYSMHCPQYFILTFHLDHYEILCLQNIYDFSVCHNEVTLLLSIIGLLLR